MIHNRRNGCEVGNLNTSRLNISENCFNSFMTEAVIIQKKKGLKQKFKVFIKPFEGPQRIVFIKPFEAPQRSVKIKT